MTFEAERTPNIFLEMNYLQSENAKTLIKWVFFVWKCKLTDC